tara:strand:- start:1846 stop:2094 length:249 start_codon:yes stop_codon:yes gene_type:complete
MSYPIAFPLGDKILKLLCVNFTVKFFYIKISTLINEIRVDFQKQTVDKVGINYLSTTQRLFISIGDELIANSAKLMCYPLLR